MFNTTRLRLITSITLLLIALVYWGFFGSPNDTPLTNPDNPERVDFFIRDAHITRFDKNGQVAHIIQSPHLQHLPVPELVSLTRPTITVTGDASGSLEISSDDGSMTDDESMIELAGNVRVIDNSELETLLVLTTAVMTLFPPESYAKTDAPVTIQQGNNQTDAIGMQLWLRENRIDLMSDVRGYYAIH